MPKQQQVEFIVDKTTNRKQGIEISEEEIVQDILTRRLIAAQTLDMDEDFELSDDDLKNLDI